jgi:hypothetical protein
LDFCQARKPCSASCSKRALRGTGQVGRGSTPGGGGTLGPESLDELLRLRQHPLNNVQHSCELAFRLLERPFDLTNLVSDGAIAARHTDKNLVNAWGIAFASNGKVRLADNGTDLSTAFGGTGNPEGITVSIPDRAPTGIVANSSDQLRIHEGKGGQPLHLCERGWRHLRLKSPGRPHPRPR